MNRQDPLRSSPPGVSPQRYRQLCQEAAALLAGDFAPMEPLLREFDAEKSCVVLDGMPFSAWAVLEHMRNRQRRLLDYIRAAKPQGEPDLTPWWPESPEPAEAEQWHRSVVAFLDDLGRMTRLVRSGEPDLFASRGNGPSAHWAVLSNVQHNAYHLGQLKTIGRQLGVW